jgi:hypothetical protein
MTIGVQAVQSLQRMKHIVQIQKDENSQQYFSLTKNQPAVLSASQISLNEDRAHR